MRQVCTYNIRFNFVVREILWHKGTEKSISGGYLYTEYISEDRLGGVVVECPPQVREVLDLITAG